MNAHATTTVPGQTDLKDSDRIAFLRLRGTLDDRSVVSFKKSVFNIQAEKRILVLDVSRLEQATNAGLGALLDALRFFRKRRGRVFLVHPNEELELLLAHFRVGDVARIVSSYEDVLNQLPHGIANSAADETVDFESSLTQFRGAHGPAVHYHYYGKNIQAPESSGEGLDVVTADPLQELGRRLHRLQDLMENRAPVQNERIEKKLEDLSGAETRIVDRLQSMERSLGQSMENLVGRMEARLIDHMDHAVPHQAASPSVLAPGRAAVFPGYRMVSCAGCGTILRIHQSGRHKCPSCQKEFTVNEKGEPTF